MKLMTQLLRSSYYICEYFKQDDNTEGFISIFLSVSILTNGVDFFYSLDVDSLLHFSFSTNYQLFPRPNDCGKGRHKRQGRKRIKGKKGIAFAATSAGTKTVHSCFMYTLEVHCESIFTGTRYLSFPTLLAFPRFSEVPRVFFSLLRSLRLEAGSTKANKKNQEDGENFFRSPLLISLTASCAVYRAQSSVNYYGPEGGLLLIGLLTSCLPLSRRRFFFLSSSCSFLRVKRRIGLYCE